MPLSPPAGVALHIPDEIPLGDLCALLRRVVVFLQGLRSFSPALLLYHDWWEHDGLHFDKCSIKFHDLFAMVETPRAIFDATPDEHAVFVGVAPEDARWYLRFRAEWDGDEKNIVGRFAIVVCSESVAELRNEVAVSTKHSLVEESSEDYYSRIIV